jgi:putative NADH-flavin reductase
VFNMNMRGVPVKVTVFGATGKIGRLVVAKLLARGHQVTALARNPSKIDIADPKLTIVASELSDRALVRGAIRGADAVISALGPSLKPGSSGTPITEGTVNIAAAMNVEGVSRYIGLATPSVPDSRDEPTIKARILPVMAKTMFPNALKEVVGMTAAVTGSDLDWTIARITSPTDQPSKGTLRVGYLGRDRVGSRMSRDDIAAFLVDQLTDSNYSKAAPAISN